MNGWNKSSTLQLKWLAPNVNLRKIYSTAEKRITATFFLNDIALPKELMDDQRCKYNIFQGMDEFHYFHEINKYELL